MTNHDAMIASGFSWIEFFGGPKDGLVCYFKGQPPQWRLAFVDPAIEVEEYKPGDLEHKYELYSNEEGMAIYAYRGEFRR